ncbi:MAG: hypothetical protein FWG74_06185, partial [Planctomycetes bacterium]|nr:hypothetical protein [Planctomycetota bacterium]
MSASSQVTGIASGFDTAAIVGQLMQIEKIPYEKLDVKKQTQQLRLQAYQAVNSMLLKFRTSASSLSSQSLWRSKVATSTNEKSLTAIANQYAVNGSYSFKVAQLATASQFLTKGFASSKSAFVKQAEGEVSHKIGEITMSSAQTRVDTSAKINDLNGGKGVYRGSVRITDRANSTSIIDLSACDTMEDVVQALNASTGAQITASIKDGALHIEDNSGGSGAIRIQNVGAGSTATDLGIAGSSEDGDNFLQGRNVYVLGNDLSLSLLRDGLGIEEGMFTLRVTSNAQYYDVQVNIDDCHTVGDIIKRVNNEIEFRVQNHYNDPYSGGGWELLEGLRFGLSDDKTSFALLGVKEGHTYQFYDSGDMSAIAKQTPAAQLGLLGRNLVGSGQTSVEFARVLGAVDSPMIKNLAGVDGYGIGSAGSSYLIDIPFDRNTLISALNGGQGVDATMPLQLRLYEGGGDISNSPSLYKTLYDVLDQSALNDLLADPNATIQELVNFMNDSIARYAADPKNEAAGLWGLNFQIDEINQRLVIAGAQGGQKIEIMGTLANSLGLIRTGGNAIEQPNSPEVNDFYRGVTLISGNDDFNGASALGALDMLHELDLSDPGNDADAVLAAILDKLNGSLNLNLQVNYIDGFGIPSVRSLQDVAVDLSDLGDDLNPDSTVAELMDAINARIQEAVNAAASAEFGETIEVSAPKLRIDTYGQGFQWSNLDTTKEFSASGTVAETLGVDRSLSPVETQPYDVLGDFRFNPKASGYLQEMAITGATQLGYLNNGASLTFAGNETDTIDFDFGEGNSISIKMGDLRTALKDTGNSLNTTLAEYADILTALVQDKLDDAGITVTVNFGVGDNRLEINVEGDDVRQLVISGAGADATRTGIGAVNVADIPVDGMTIGLAGLKAAQLAPQEVAGLGDINMTIGGIEIKLSTEGLSGDSTLAQLVDRLNRELEKAA